MKSIAATGGVNGGSGLSANERTLMTPRAIQQYLLRREDRSKIRPIIRVNCDRLRLDIFLEWVLIGAEEVDADVSRAVALGDDVVRDL